VRVHGGAAALLFAVADAGPTLPFGVVVAAGLHSQTGGAAAALELAAREHAIAAVAQP
jgi:hypothetical protein